MHDDSAEAPTGTPRDHLLTELPGSPIVVAAADGIASVDPTAPARPTDASRSGFTAQGEEQPAGDDHGGDQDALEASFPHTDPLTALSWLAAAALGVSELFRVVFATELGERGRVAFQPGQFPLADGLAAGPAEAPMDPTTVSDTVQSGTDEFGPLDIGTVNLAGAGAIGQAAVLALRAAQVRGRLHVVDPETVTLTNLQRYVLTEHTSIGASKVGLIKDALRGSGLTVTGESTAWHQATGSAGDLDRGTGGADSPPNGEADKAAAAVQVVLTALDSAADRIGVAAGLPDRAYNAWTQVADLGWSRHEAFGEEPCLACLYYPERQRPNDDELIAVALDQPRLRVLAYLTQNVAIGFPLVGLPTIAEMPPPPRAERWTQVSLLEDLIDSGVVPRETSADWADRTVGGLYRDGVCAGGLLPVGDLPGEVIVPLAHQSALAGILLATELVLASDPRLRARRGHSAEHRYDVLRGLPQVLARPRARTPNCICSDADYLTAWDEKGAAPAL